MSGQIAHAYALLGDGERARAADADARQRLARAAAWHEHAVLTRAEAWVSVAAGQPTRAAHLLLARSAEIEAQPVFRAQMLGDALSVGADPAAVLRELEDVAARCDTPLVAALVSHAAALASADPEALLGAARELEMIGALLEAGEAAAQAAAILAAAALPAAARRAAARGARLLDRCEGAITPALQATRPGRARLTRREREFAGLRLGAAQTPRSPSC